MITHISILDADYRLGVLVMGFKKFRRDVPLLFLTLPGMLYLFIFAYLPMFGIMIAFKNYKFTDGIWGSEWVGFQNFKFLFATDDAWRITFNTLYLNGIFIVTGTVASILLALLMNEVKHKFVHNFTQSAVFLPFLLSWVLVGYFVLALLSANGLANNLLQQFGIEGVSWYYKPSYWPAILAVIAIWKNAGYVSLIYLASIMGISSEYYEAARIDGASKLQQIRYITLPLLTPVITIMVLLSIGRIFYADFGMFYNVTRDSGSLYVTTDVIDTYVYRMLRILGDMGMASAAGFYQSIVGFVLVLFSNLAVRKFNKDNALF